MRIVVTGSRGQLGRELVAQLSAVHTVFAIDRDEHDITDPSIVKTVMGLNPDVIFNAAAYTLVDRCSSDPNCFKVNVQGTEYLAQAAEAAGAEFLHVSTNEVFPGDRSEPYVESDPTGPINAYGVSKLQGEQAAQRATDRLYIVRTAWLFNKGGNNFITKIIGAAHQHGALRVVDDEFGNPTYAPDLAAGLIQLIGTHRYGIYHLTNAGFCSRYDFAREILRLADLGHIPVTAIASREWVRASQPPLRAILANVAAASLGVHLRPWQEALAAYFERLT